MRKLSVTDLIQGDETCYSFVIAISKRAREIAEQANEDHVLLDERPVRMAVREYMQGKFKIANGGEPKNEEEAERQSAPMDDADEAAGGSEGQNITGADDGNPDGGSGADGTTPSGQA